MRLFVWWDHHCFDLGDDDEDELVLYGEPLLCSMLKMLCVFYWCTLPVPACVASGYLLVSILFAHRPPGDKIRFCAVPTYRDYSNREGNGFTLLHHSCGTARLRLVVVYSYVLSKYDVNSNGLRPSRAHSGGFTISLISPPEGTYVLTAGGHL